MPIDTPTTDTEPGTYSSGGSYPSGPEPRDEFTARARQNFNEAYDRTSRKLNDTYRQVTEYGQDHPGTMTLIAFGAGIGTGLLLAGLGSRSRTERILSPILSAVADVAKEVLR